MVQHKLRSIMKIKHIYLVLGIISVFYLGFSNSSTQDDSKTNNKSLIKFSHKVHTDAAECAECHTKVTESVELGSSLLPVMDDCAACHDVEDKDNCELCHYKDVYEPLNPKPSGLIFNHKYHLTEQELNCQTCHKGFEDIEYSFESSNAFPAMTDCYTCHNNTTVASNECSSCHISTVNLLPDNHKTVGFFKTHKFSAGMDNDCKLCHSDFFCESCHVTSGITEANTSRDFITPYSPHNFVDNAKQQNIVRIHDFNYRYTHGIDAKGKTNDCQTCHQTETFCAECHSAEGGDFALGGIVPLSHAVPNFATFGVGTGGGEHAILAKRDIENCAACHDVQGADPNCILCHSDPDGVKGTNPKTHEINFMRDVEGDWHTDVKSICYDCHSSSNTPGVGFCGYCHGVKN